MNVFYIVLITLIIYSLISTIIYIFSKYNEDVLMFFGLGIVGLTVAAIVKAIRKIKDLFKYSVGKYSIFEEKSTGKRYKCKVNDAHNIDWLQEYKMIKRYATKSEWNGIPNFNEDILVRSRINCDNCKFDEECQCEFPYTDVKCKHNEYGEVLEFDKFCKR